jgi:tRNA threonylcarbamoyladenosine biosynthesis protein TsaE
LGAGKTTLTKEIGRLLGVKKTVISPTFVLLKSYPIKHTPWKTFHHIDAYRFDKPEEVLKIGWSELIQDPKHLVFVEWPEKIGSMVPEDIITIFLKHAPKEKRHIEIKKAPSKK